MLLNQKKQIIGIHILGIVLIGFILSVPAIFGEVYEAHDLVAFHLKWSKNFTEQFWTGEIYPRWLQNMNSGLGSPAFFFYAPIPYYFSSLFHPFFPNDQYGWHQLSLSAALALIASGITAYIWLKDITKKTPAFMAAILYMALPYHLTIDFYTRFAYAEHWSFVWLPLLLYFTRKISQGSKFALVGFTISYALLIMTHLITVLIFSVIPIFYLLILASRKKRKSALVFLIIAMLLGIGLSAIYLLPAMTTQEYISMKTIITGRYFYQNNFLFWGNQFFNSKFAQYTGFQTVLLAGLAYAAYSLARKHPLAIIRRESTYWIVIAMSAFLMTLPLSKPIWEIFFIIQRIQHPWRFNTIVLVATTALIALGISAIQKPINLATKRILIISGSLVAILLLSGAIVVHIYTNPELLVKYTNIEQQIDVNQELSISLDAPEYRPRWVSPETFEKPQIRELANSFDRAKIAAGKGNLSVEKWQPRNIILHSNATTNLWVNIHQFYYPGWTAKINGESRILPVQPSTPEGLLTVWIPQGKHQVSLTLKAGLEERIGQIISAISALIVIFFIFWFHQGGLRKFRTQENNSRTDQLTRL
ncbi:6-pyruvoyl-tetrahydropterin synthase-related protein [Aerosakkonemataceae cyanobacterium BLCC-F154]|uniref:6-pyruvoyl-tetrahydropterin synthase-related protein n=1 Tax=Floridaenema fluviatile BLCC-F154 TaxID=3153640 RepID=A0ABV4YHN8_9CYAN